MPSPITAIDLIRRAMMHIGVLAEGEVPSADQASDGLDALNDVLETWSIESLAVYGALPEQFNLVAGQSTYTVGPGGEWSTTRPISISSAVMTVDNVDFPIGQWSYTEYSSLAIKYQPGIPEKLVYINDAPLARVILYPVPYANAVITVDIPRLLTEVASVSDTISLPPGYARALQYAVAEELAPQYGSPIDVSARARSTKAVIKRANRVPMVAGFDATLVRPRTGGMWAVSYGPTPTPTPTGGSLLSEGGFALLLESGDKILLEA